LFRPVFFIFGGGQFPPYYIYVSFRLAAKVDVSPLQSRVCKFTKKYWFGLECPLFYSKQAVFITLKSSKNFSKRNIFLIFALSFASGNR
jgi:hypothetical protein